MIFEGHCHCQRIEFSVYLPRPLVDYVPRKCDCDFCEKYDIHYLSDTNGHITIDKIYLNNFAKQGDNLAHFIQCSHCNDIIAACHQSGEQDYRCAINSQLLKDKALLRLPQVVSPRLLSAEEKLERWQKLWMSIRF